MGDVIQINGGQELYQPRPILVYEAGACTDEFVNGFLQRNGRLICNSEGSDGFYTNTIDGFNRFLPDFHDVVNAPKEPLNSELNTPIGISFLAGTLYTEPVGVIAEEPAFLGQSLIDAVHGVRNQKEEIADISMTVALYDKPQEPASEIAQLLYTHARHRFGFSRDVEFSGNAFEEDGFEFALSFSGLLLAFRHLKGVDSMQAGSEFADIVLANREQVLAYSSNTPNSISPNDCA